GLRAVEIRDTPKPPFNVPTCLARAARHAWYPASGCSFALAGAVRPALYAAEREAATDMPQVRFVDLTDRVCPTDVCEPVQDGVLVYRDDNHLTGAFARHLAPALEPQLEAALAGP
ncbi:MAG: hypothetical protein JO005_11470, partial [Gammaproteobacteria bacterium]|nr:hypothetical protein [Gammaproteobacteria bacterium]